MFRPPVAPSRRIANESSGVLLASGRMVLEQLSSQVPPSERANSEDPRALARMATRAEMREPGTLERALCVILMSGIVISMTIQIFTRYLLGQPLVWVVREGPTIIGHYATMPVRLSLGGKEIQAAWGTDAMVAPERQRRGLGEELFRTWDRTVGAALGLPSVWINRAGERYDTAPTRELPDLAALPEVLDELVAA